MGSKRSARLEPVACSPGSPSGSPRISRRAPSGPRQKSKVCLRSYDSAGNRYRHHWRQVSRLCDLCGQTGLVTGASGGIGGGIAKAVHRQGAEVMVAGTRSASLETLAGELGARVHVGLADLADSTAPERLAKEAEAAMGRVDILVTNARHTPDPPPLQIPAPDCQTVLQRH